ncbi:sensor histidine kinase [Caldimonas brevitalea]|uniref:histidine kinase n=1 Tax=Caldimonas brevitalea TaxID=413882 RepID=A0A0G3BE66_9BURK|nr:sensor histidine kinase [Caldimonas brevitalea]AKJ27597.1 sensor histidine kinase [Caldimonas brevitalea]
MTAVSLDTALPGDGAPRQWLDRIVETQEQERRHFARELHDTLGQHVTALQLDLDALLRSDACPPALRPSLARVQRDVRRLDDAIDQLSHRLRPLVLDDLGLHDALQTLVDDLAPSAGLALELHTAGLDGRRFAATSETTVFRVVQEALTNVIRHAQATRASVIVEFRGGVLRAIVEDNGRGFDPASVRQGSRARGRLGLLNMSERAALAGGRAEIESAPGCGCTVYLTLAAATVSADTTDRGGAR